MSRLGDCPAGSEHDPMAPWNRDDENELICPTCGSYDVETETCVERNRLTDWEWTFREDAFCNDCGDTWRI